MPLDELARESTISLGGSSTRRIFQNRFAEARGLAQTYAARDDRLVNTLGKMLAHVRHHLCAEVGSTVEHCHNNTTNLKPVVRAGIAHLLDQPNNFHQALEREILTLDRRQKFIGGGECIAHENSERRRTIKQNKLERAIVLQRLKRFRQPCEMIRHSGNLYFGTSQIDIGGCD